LNAGTKEPKEMAVARQHGKHVPLATNIYMSTEELLDAVVCMFVYCI
jgi:hypothetical protein